MITRLRLKNWRSCKDVTLDNLTPLTVFIGANSAGKTNILDALHFLREIVGGFPFQALFARGGIEKIRTLGLPENEHVEIELTFRPQPTSQAITYLLTMTGSENTPAIDEVLSTEDGITWLKVSDGEDGLLYYEETGENISLSDPHFGWQQLLLSEIGQLSFSDTPIIYPTFQFITQRWQLFHENFMPPQTQPLGTLGSPYLVSPNAGNVPFMLSFMQSLHQDIYEDLQADLVWLLGHVKDLGLEQTEREIRFFVKEGKPQEAPTISAGTFRIIAILTALHALNIPRKNLTDFSAVLAIEEPDMSVHPVLFERLIEFFRLKAEEGRQFFLTTHNPRFLNHFQPAEVWTVERGEDGLTHVQKVNQAIFDIWKDEYGLGDVWMTRAFGGVPE